MQGKIIKPDPFKRMKGEDVTLEWLETDPTAMTEPILIEQPDGLGMKMPEDLTVSDVAEIVGEDTPVEVIGTALLSGIMFHILTVFYRCCLSIKSPWVDAR